MNKVCRGYVISSGNSFASGFTDSGYKYLVWTDNIKDAMMLTDLDRAKEFLELGTKKAEERRAMLKDKLYKAWAEELVKLHKEAKVMVAVMTYELEEID